MEKQQLWEEIFSEYIWISKQIKALEERKKELDKVLIDNRAGDVQYWADKVQKITQQRVSLKEWVDVDQIEIEFGDKAIKKAVDTTYLKSIPDSHKYLEIKPLSFIKILTVK